MPPKRPGGQVVQAEVAIQQSLKNCLVNLPANLVSVLVNADAIAQDVVVELSYRQVPPPGVPDSKSAASLKSVFVGWTGLESKRKLAPVVGRNGLNDSKGGTASREQNSQTVDCDAAFARLIGLSAGQKVGVILHLNPPEAHTINIEPLTPVDWEMIELHAQFLELNFLNQVRALPNPQSGSSHPLTLHLSPTTTANIIVTSLAPTPPTESAFVKIAPDAEVIVAPKTRQRAERTTARDTRSVGAASRRSGRSVASTIRRRSGRDESTPRGPLFLRGIARTVASEWFDDANMDAIGLTAWVDRDVLLNRALKGVSWVSVSVVLPAGLHAPTDVAKEQEQEAVATRVVARLAAWDDAPDGKHVALSADLCKVLGCEDLVGGLIRIDAAPAQVAKLSTFQPMNGTRESKEPALKTIRICPFSKSADRSSSTLRFGGESKQDEDSALTEIKTMYGRPGGLLHGPVTDGMVLPPSDTDGTAWPGGVIRFEPPRAQSTLSWVLLSDKKPHIEFGTILAKPVTRVRDIQQGEALPTHPPHLVGIDLVIDKIQSHLAHASSVLLTGGLGSGKSQSAQLLAHRLRARHLFHTIYFPCQKLVTDETRVSTIHNTIKRLFAAASWSARSGGRSLIILDDLDKLCPAETELQVGNENGRSRQISECITSIVRQHGHHGSGVVLLATAQAKETLNSVLVGSHIVREIVSLKAPAKEGRRKVLEMLARHGSAPAGKAHEHEAIQKSNGFLDSPSSSRPNSAHSNSSAGLHDETSDTVDCIVVDTDLDFLDLAGQTDGYMPGDLVLLTSRARNEALVRSVNQATDSSNIILSTEDYTRALQGFTPASLRNVTLQSSTTKWDSIGGLQSTRQILLETLQYPTTYAPIFAQCPLRLRSGLLLYGFPGCGKTLLASAVAGECGLNFISVKGPEILNKYIGASEKSVRDLFERAEAARPCVLFFDEFDSIAPKRGHDSTGVTDRVVNQLLTQMDGAEGLSGVYVLAATSRPDLIDPALLRPGRLDKSLLCDMPDVEDRIDILKAVSWKLHIDPAILDSRTSHRTFREIAHRTEGLSGADLQAVMYNAQLEAIHDVLGDMDISNEPSQPAKRGNKAGKASKSHGKDSRVPDFSYFRYGNDSSSEVALDPPASKSTQLTERAMITQKIAHLQATRRKQKALQHAQNRPHAAKHTRDDDSAGVEDETARKEPQIEWKHIERSLATTRSSISAQERARLEGIYREFVVGRNGEMPNGQGPREVGGRTSLM